jgi:hypothetical protein
MNTTGLSAILNGHSKEDFLALLSNEFWIKK